MAELTLHYSTKMLFDCTVSSQTLAVSESVHSSNGTAATSGRGDNRVCLRSSRMLHAPFPVVMVGKLLETLTQTLRLLMQ